MASGGGDDAEMTENEWQGLRDRLKSVSVRERRRTFDRMAMIVGSDVLPQPLGPHQVMGQAVEPRMMTVEPSTRKLRNFSGADKIGNGEIDFKHWKRAAIRIKEDMEISEAHKKRIILQSLQGRAEDAVDLHRGQSVDQIVDILDKMFGSVADGSDLLADFYHQFQPQNQSASDYLANLFILISENYQVWDTVNGGPE